MLRIFQQIQSLVDFDDVLEAAAVAMVEIAGFDLAALSIRTPHGDFETRAVAGCDTARQDTARQAVIGHVYSAADVRAFLDRAESWGSLRFLSHERCDRLPPDMAGYVPDVAVSSEPDSWHPEDTLLALIQTAEGEIAGFASVDLPRDQRRPGSEQRELLEVVAAQVGIAIHHAQLTERLRSSEQAFRLAFDGAANGVCVVDLRPSAAGRFVKVNPAMAEMLGMSTEGLLAGNFANLAHPADEPFDLAAWRRVLLRKGPYRFERRHLHRDGSVRWLAFTTSLGYDSDGQPTLAVCQLEDVSGRRSRHAHLSHLARHDDLTGLPNRRAMAEYLSQAVDDVVLLGEPGILLFCDLDGFKKINDAYGHTVGDRVLQVIAQRLNRTVRTEDTVIRYGGDEFIVIAPSTSQGNARVLAERLQEAIAKPMRVDDVIVGVSISIGQAEITATTQVEDMFREADAAMYRAKLVHRASSMPRQRVEG
jgi:diguanylate cyclase (GGDEF)-like protein/PAS domain S-box-containing protein